MTVRELIQKLQKCSPDAVVCAEVWSDPQIQDVKEYVVDDKHYVYVGDDFDELEFQLGLYDEEE